VGRGGRERARRQAAGGTHDCAKARRTLTTASFTFRGGAEHACCRACHVPVRGAAGFAFCQPVQKGDEGSPCKFHLLQGACSSPVVCSAPLFLLCSLQSYRAATAAAAHRYSHVPKCAATNATSGAEPGTGPPTVVSANGRVPVEGLPEPSRFKSLSCPTSAVRPIEYQGVFAALSHRF
jgi:hypothetical protein